MRNGYIEGNYFKTERNLLHSEGKISTYFVLMLILNDPH